MLIPTTAYIVVQIPSVQTFLAKKAVNILSGKINGTVSIDKIYYAFFNRVIIDNICITDNSCDTLLHCSKISLNVQAKSILEGNIKVRKISIADGEFNIRNITPDSTNLSRALAPLTANQDTISAQSDKKGGFSINAGVLNIENFDFSTSNRFADKPNRRGPHTIDWSNIVLKDINLHAQKINFKDGKLSLQMDSLSFNESKGMNLNILSGEITMGKKEMAVGQDTTTTNEIRIDNLHLKDDYSDIYAHYYSMQYDSFSDFSDYVNKVKMGIDLEDALLDFKTLHSFTGGIEDIKLKLYITGETIGTVSNMQSKSLKVYSGTKKTYLDFAAHLSGLPNSKETMATFKINQCHTYTDDIAYIISSVTTTFDKTTLSRFAPGEKFTFNGSLNGFFEDFVAFGELSSNDMGKVNVDIICRNDRGNGYEIIGHVKGEEFDVGRFIQNKMLGKLSCSATISGIAGKKRSELYIENVRISKLGFNDYNYSNIIATGNLTNSEFDGRVICSDPNLNFMFHGLFALSNKNNNSLYKFNLALGYANLNALNFDKRDVSNIRFQADADLTKTTQGDMFGDITIKSLSGTVDKTDYHMGNINLQSFSSNNNYTLELMSGFASAKYTGTAPVSSFISDLLNMSAKKQLSNLFADNEHEQIQPCSDDYQFVLHTYDTKALCKFLMPDLYIADTSEIFVNLDRNSNLDINFNSSLIALKNNYFKDISLNLGNRDSSIIATIDAKMIQSGNIIAENNIIKTKIKDNSIDFSYSFNNDGASENSADIHTIVSFPNQKESSYKVLAHILASKLTINSSKWDINPASIYYKDKDIAINNFKIENESQELNIYGRMSASNSDTLNISMDKFDAALVNPFIGKPLDIKGYFSGKASLFSLFGEERGILLDIKGDSVHVFNNEVGSIDILSKWDDSNKRFNLLLNNKLHDRNPLNIIGYYKPDTKNLMVKATLRDFILTYFEPFLTSVVSDVSGTLSGDIALEGPLDKLAVSSSDSYFKDLSFKLLFTQVPYTLNGPLEMSEKGIKFNNIEIKDKYGHTGRVSGGVNYNYFNDMALNTRISVNNILGLNTTAADNESFYGRAFASGLVRLTGPLDKILLDINITTNQNSNIHIPLSSSAKEQTSILTFVNNTVKSIDPYDSLIVKNTIKKKDSNSELGIRVKVNATPEAEVHLEINKSLGDVIKSRGTGQIEINVNQAKDLFDIKGDYSIDQGSYKFVFLGLASRDFIINPGGTINFTGDIMQSNLDLTATYRTKASIGTLIADTTSVNTRRTVDCGIGITGKLANPQLKFSIDIPDLDPTTKGRVESALNTEDKRLKQLLTVLLSGSFIPDEQSGIVNNTTILYSNASEIMSNQLNNVFRQLDIPLDLGFNYQPGENGRNIFDVAVSTQLFNNRVTINGNIGNRQYMTSNTSDVVGDVDVEIKLNESGKIRLNLFSHSADQYSNYLDQTQRNGVGIVYQEEFDTFKELWRKIFWSKARREEYDRQQRAARRTIPDNNPSTIK
ncbi:MAG: translocation/assembly module TamB domain-containing protein [Bacteroidales bacterium]|nr:translocation/assembly module TamB domain-containing protein [Bacteroidales bacterium]MDD4670134.1 translocation/assembly module TamB domain-containing protein [Bacteroidales bacterium]